MTDSETPQRAESFPEQGTAVLKGARDRLKRG